MLDRVTICPNVELSTFHVVEPMSKKMGKDTHLFYSKFIIFIINWFLVKTLSLFPYKPITLLNTFKHFNEIDTHVTSSLYPKI